MKINVKYFDSLKKITGKSEEVIEMDNYATMEQLLQKLKEKYGNLFSDLVMDSKGNIKEDILLFLNGRSIKAHKEIYGEFLTDEAIAVILSVKGGG
jgi:MoaD family protein